MSEGINFSDDLARCVVVVGMPYPDSRDIVLQERMKHADRAGRINIVASSDPNISNNNSNNSSNNCSNNSSSSSSNGDKVSGKDIYEGMCMRQVNQSIGRSIRHINDYSSIVLLDSRFSRQSVISQLPGWIARNLVVVTNFEEVPSKLDAFLTSLRR